MKRCIQWLFFLAVLTVLPLPAMAHPGKTDGSGGHTDRSTGEYHYHHGYGEHDHYDMNGDGIVDCPYNFDDQTNHNSGSSGNSTYPQPSTQSTVPKIVIATAPAEEIETEEEVKTVPIWVYWVFGIMLITIIVMVKAYFSLDSEKKQNRTR